MWYPTTMIILCHQRRESFIGDLGKLSICWIRQRGVLILTKERRYEAFNYSGMHRWTQICKYRAEVLKGKKIWPSIVNNLYPRWGQIGYYDAPSHCTFQDEDNVVIVFLNVTNKLSGQSSQSRGHTSWCSYNKVGKFASTIRHDRTRFS